MESYWLVGTIAGLNTMVFGLWRSSDPNVHLVLREHFTLSAESIASGRYHTLLLCSLSHASPVHLLGNMFMLVVFGSQLHPVLGSASFVSMYVTAALISSCAWIVQQRNAITRSASWREQRLLFHTNCIG